MLQNILTPITMLLVNALANVIILTKISLAILKMSGVYTLAEISVKQTICKKNEGKLGTLFTIMA